MGVCEEIRKLARVQRRQSKVFTEEGMEDNAMRVI